MKKTEYRINESIRAAEVRLVENNNSTVVSLSDALKKADELGLDLVEVSPAANPPVCKIIDYGKFLYQQERAVKITQRNQVKSELKELRFGPQTDDHDFEFKLNHAKKFLQDGDKVRAYVFFKGRQILFKDQGEAILKRLADSLVEFGKVDQEPKLEGKKMFMLISPLKKSK